MFAVWMQQINWQDPKDEERSSSQTSPRVSTYFQKGQTHKHFRHKPRTCFQQGSVNISQNSYGFFTKALFTLGYAEWDERGQGRNMGNLPPPNYKPGMKVKSSAFNKQGLYEPFSHRTNSIIEVMRPAAQKLEWYFCNREKRRHSTHLALRLAKNSQEQVISSVRRRHAVWLCSCQLSVIRR